MGIAAPVRWGILSTAHINRLAHPARAGVGQGRPGSASRAATGRAPRSTRERGQIPPRLRLVRGAARRPGDRGGVHLAAEHPPLRVVDPRAGGRQARALREAAVAVARPRSRRSFDAAERAGRLLSEAFMYRHNPQTARLASLVAAGAIGELRLVRSTFSYSLYDADNIRLRPEVEGGSLMDVGCYCVSGSRLLGGRAGVGVRPRLDRPERHRLGLHGHDCASPATCSALFDCRDGDSSSATSSRRSAARARCSSTTRGTASSP